MDCSYESFSLGTVVPSLGCENLNVPQPQTDEHSLSRILKDGWVGMNVSHWIKLIDQKKILKIDFQEFIDMLNKSNLPSHDITLVKDSRKKAQRAKSSTLCHRNKRIREQEQMNEIIHLKSLRENLMNEKVELLTEITKLKHQIENC